MARNQPDSKSTPFPGDLPELVLEHHGRTLATSMKEWKTRGRVPPVLLLTGQFGIGKRSISYFLAQWILCEKYGIGGSSSDLVFRPCQECSSCLKVVAGNEVDITEIAAETHEDKASSTKPTIKIDQFRKLKASVGYGAHESRYKMILIPQAEQMTPQASNSVLKLLEEPPPGWVFFLTSQDSTLLLPTLVSRCQILKLKPFSTKTIQSLLELDKIESKRISVCAALAQGSWGRALEFAEEETWEQRKVLFQFLREPQGVLLALIDWAAQSPGRLGLLLDLLEQMTHELILWSTQPEGYQWTQVDGADALLAYAQQALKKKGSLPAIRDFWIDRAERLAQARQELSAPLNRKLFIQDLLLPWIGLGAQS